MKTLKYENSESIKDLSNASISELLEENKKLVSFVGPRQSGTSFLINNIAKILARNFIDVAILDVTSNRADYYIYTHNKDTIKIDIKDCLKNIAEGDPVGIQAEKNLVVYTDLLRENEKDLKIEKILETLLKRHQVTIIDADFKTDVNYFLYSQKNYLVQTMDILTIQEFTEFLSKLKSQNAINDDKIRMIINKYISLEGLSIKDIIDRLAFYNSPSMSYMQQLFERDGLKYTTIQYNQFAYEAYMQYIVKYKVPLDEYSDGFREQLESLAEDIIKK